MGWSRDTIIQVAQRTGYPVVAAWSSHNAGTMGTVYGPMLHHTGSAKSKSDYATLQVVRDGRPGLENSLCMYGLGKSGTIYLINDKISWHAGVGSWNGIADGNGHFAGIEAESSGASGDWTSEQLDAYPRLVASILLETGRGIDWMPMHKEFALPKGRKSDPSGLDTNEFKKQVDKYLANPGLLGVGGVEQDLKDDERQWLSDIRVAVVGNTRQFEVFREDPAIEVNGKKGSGAMVLAAPGIWYPIASVAHFSMFITHGLCSPDYTNVTWNVFDLYKGIYLSAVASVDVSAIAKAVSESLPKAPPVDVAMTEDQITKLAALLDDDTGEEWKAKVAEVAASVNDEADRRNRDNDSSTGTTS